MQNKPNAKSGDRIRCKGITVTIATIHYQDWHQIDGWSIEFTDTKGKYRNWKQWADGGELIES